MSVSHQPGVSAGAVITACDGRPIQSVIDERAEFEDETAGLESTDDIVARALFVDEANPLFRRLGACRIAGSDVTLQWSPITAERLAEVQGPVAPVHGGRAEITAFGHEGAWVRLPSFDPPKTEYADYDKVIATLPSLRDKQMIVFDVRGNGGGDYSWFIGVIRALWGPDYASYYARARLQIQNVVVGALPSAPSSVIDTPDEPPDPDMDAATRIGMRVERTAAGRTATLLGRFPAAVRERPPGPPPPDPVKAKVYVLTDYWCGSSCIAFVDELRRFPGVEQIGRDTYVDRLSGSPLVYPLPSGAAKLRVPSLVRIDRERGDNVPDRPTRVYSGDMSNTSALQGWVEQLTRLGVGARRAAADVRSPPSVMAGSSKSGAESTSNL